MKSYELILDFFGIELVNKETGELKRAVSYKDRYKATVIDSGHNRLRVTRILLHLNVVGFKRYAK